MSAAVDDLRVRAGCDYLDRIYVEHAWRQEAIDYALAGSPARELLACVEYVARQAGAAGDHEWHLARGWTIDFGTLGYPDIDSGPPRRWRERAAYAELEAAWWRALLRPRGA